MIGALKCGGCESTDPIAIARVKVSIDSPIQSPIEVPLCARCVRNEASGPTCAFFSATFVYGDAAAARLLELAAKLVSRGARAS